MLPTVSISRIEFDRSSATIEPNGVSNFFSSSSASATTMPSMGRMTCTISVRPRLGSSSSVSRGTSVGSIFSSAGWMKNVMWRRIRMNFCCAIVSLRRSVTSPIVNVRSLPGLMTTLPVGVTVVIMVRPVSVAYQSSTFFQSAFSKWTATVFSADATAPGAPGAGMTGTAAGWPSARSTGPVSPAAAASTPGSQRRSLNSFQNGTAPRRAARRGPMTSPRELRSPSPGRVRPPPRVGGDGWRPVPPRAHRRTDESVHTRDAVGYRPLPGRATENCRGAGTFNQPPVYRSYPARAR